MDLDATVGVHIDDMRSLFNDGVFCRARLSALGSE